MKVLLTGLIFLFASSVYATDYNLQYFQKAYKIIQNQYLLKQRVKIREVPELVQDYYVDPAPQRVTIQYELAPVYQREIQVQNYNYQYVYPQQYNYGNKVQYNSHCY